MTGPRAAPASAPESNLVLEFTDPAGQRLTWQVRPRATVGEQPGPLPTRLLVSVASGHSVLQRSVPERGRADGSRLYDLLENEVWAGIRLARRYPGQYPAELVRLVGYDLDVAEPFLLLAKPRGEPCSRFAGRLRLDPLQAFQAGLFRSLLLLAEAGLVHGNLSPDSIRWDEAGSLVQVDGLGWAAGVGESRRAHGRTSWASPQQRAGRGTVSPADDVWSAGMVVFYIATGRDVSGLTGPPDLANRGAALRGVLADVFADSPAGRPDAAGLLHRVGAPAAVPAGPAADDGLAEGRREFDRVLREKWPPPDTAAPPGSPRRRVPRRIAVAAVAVTVVVVAVLAVVLTLANGSWS